MVVETVDRTGLVMVQTPQAFPAAALRAAYAGDLDDGDRLRVARRARAAAACAWWKATLVC